MELFKTGVTVLNYCSYCRKYRKDANDLLVIGLPGCSCPEPLPPLLEIKVTFVTNIPPAHPVTVPDVFQSAFKEGELEP